MSAKEKISVLLVNLGSPEAPTPEAVRPYLKEFLSDPRVIEVSPWIWKPILHGIILRTRPKASAAKYKTVWTPEGSPLIVHTRALASALQKEFEALVPGAVQVDWAMRYGAPSVKEVLERIHLKDGIQKVLVVPLYPQYSATTTATVCDALGAALAGMRSQPAVRILRDYHDHPLYIRAIADSIRAHWEQKGGLESDSRLVLSFHGMPKSYSDKGDPYLSQCRRSAELIRNELGVSEEKCLMTFQSRFGKEEWLQPYTDVTVRGLAEKGIKRLDILCPGFSADCLETLEEIDGEVREEFIGKGGQEFNYIGCLNAEERWAASFTKILENELSGWI